MTLTDEATADTEETGSTRRLRVVIMNDFDVVVLGLTSMLGAFDDRVEVVDTAVREPSDEPADLALVDTFANERELQRIREQARAEKLVVYVWGLTEDKAQSALRQGADGVLDKSLTGHDLVRALEEIAEGRQVVSPAGRRPGLVEAGEDADEARWPGIDAGLSSREAEVLALVTRGLSNEEITRHCFITTNTLKSYIRNAYRKIGVSTRSQAIVWAVNHGFSTESPD